MAAKIKYGLVGIGNIGSWHAGYLPGLPMVEMVGVCDIDRAKADRFAAQCGCRAYYTHEEMFADSGLEAVQIATPHYAHTPISEHAFDIGLHVLCEKPLAVHVNDARRMLAAYHQAKAKNPALVFGIMFQERLLPHYRKLKDLVSSGELGQLVRVTWINTEYFRTQSYYNSGGWRATWAGEGGGILTNQCPHTLDMYQYLFGLPARITGFASLGKYHNIEVEDEVTAYLEHDNGMVAHLVVSTGESPGTNRLEIVGEHGKLVYEQGKLSFERNRASMLTYLQTTSEGFANVECWHTDIPVPTHLPSGHQVVTEHFLNSIVTGEEQLIAHGTEGLNSVMIANGIMQSSFDKHTVTLPLDGDTYAARLRELISNSNFVKTTSEDSALDLADSFGK